MTREEIQWLKENQVDKYKELFEDILLEDSDKNNYVEITIVSLIIIFSIILYNLLC